MQLIFNKLTSIPKKFLFLGLFLECETFLGELSRLESGQLGVIQCNLTYPLSRFEHSKTFPSDHFSTVLPLYLVITLLKFW